MNQSTGTNAPSILPMVEMAYREPLTCPLCFTLLVTRRIANGETRPKSVTGTAKSKTLPKRELTKALTETWAIAFTDQERIPWLTNGISEVARAARAVIMQSTRADG